MLRWASTVKAAGRCRTWRSAALLASVALLTISSRGFAQSGSRIPDTPGGDALRLNAALARLGRDPRDVVALIDAGNAALATHDIDAAIGFFKRADQVSPRNPRVLSGLASATLQNDDPVGAIAIFDQAQAAGAHDAAMMADQGLAHDLVGDNLRAQQLYHEALKRSTDPETQRRLALSQVIAGDAVSAEVTLRPLLQAQDRAGWRTRAFVFAISGEVDQATTVAKTLLPPDLAAAIVPYFRYMPQLTRAQQAAAANLGVFPRASDIGHDDPRVVQYLASAGGPAPTAVDRALAPAGQPLGKKAEREPRALTRSQRAAAFAARTAPPDPVPERQEESATVQPVPARVALQGTYGPPNVPVSGNSVVTRPAAAAAASPTAMVSQLPASRPPAPAPRRTQSLAAAFSDLGKPTTAASARAGSVDIARLEAARAKAAKPPPPSHPSRIWVQIETGRDRDALATDWHRFVRESGAVLRGHEPSVSEWGARNRLLTGPFESEAAAQKFVQQLAKAGVSGPFMWGSPAGQVVDSLDAR